MTHLSLFNGIGGFMLAAEFIGWTNVAYVEKINWLNDLIKKRFPDAKGYKFIENFYGSQYRGAIDIISGSDPCQPHSCAGLGKGTKDDRYLWPQMFRCIREIRPTWVINENVIGTISNGVLDIKISDLESEGYACQAYNIPAEAVGALHKRERIWLVAHNPDFIIKNRASGKYDPKKVEKIISKRHQIQYSWQPVDLWPVDPNDNSERWEKQYIAQNADIPDVSQYFGFGSHPHGNIPKHIIESGIVGMLNGLPEGMDYADRNKRCMVLGNAIVWQIAFEIFQCIDIISNQ